MNPSAFPAIFPSTATGAMLVMVSSMAGNPDAPAMKILDLKYDDGTPVVHRLDWVQSCIVCKRKGIADRCTHIVRTPERHIGVNNMARLSKLLSATNPDAHKIEMEYVVLLTFFHT